MDWACDHLDMRSVSHFQSSARTEPKSWNVSQFRLWNSGPLKSARMLGVPGCGQSERRSHNPHPLPPDARRDG